MKVFLLFIAVILFSAQAEDVSVDTGVTRFSVPREFRKNNLSLNERETLAKMKLTHLRSMIGKMTDQLKAKTASKKVALEKRNARIRVNMAKYEAKVKIQNAKLSGLKRYKGKVGVGNYMSGGPVSKPSKGNWLSKYQHRIFTQKAGARNMPLRLEIGKKLESLYKTAKINDSDFLTEFLKEAGIKKIIPKVMMETWGKAKEWLIKQQFKPFLENQKLKKQLLIAKKRMQRKKEADKANKDNHDYSKLTDKESNRLNRVEETILEPKLDEEVMRGTKNQLEFYGCVNCVADKTAKINYHTDLDRPKPPLSKAARAWKKKNDARKKKKAALKKKKKAAKRKAAAAKKSGKKLPKDPKAEKAKKAKKAFIKKRFEDFRKKQLQKLTIRDVPLLTHFLDRYGSDRPTDDVKTFRDDVIARIRDAAVERQLSQAERDELLLAKVEALEGTVAARAGVPNIVKKLAKDPPKKLFPKLPSLDPPAKKKDAAAELQRKVAIAFGSGYLEDEFKTSRTDLDHAVNMSDDATQLSDSLKKKAMTNMATKPVWTMFDGPQGDHNQIRAGILNEHRIKYPNEPLVDGTKPW